MFVASWSASLPEPAQSLTPAFLPSPALVYQGRSQQLCIYLNNETTAMPIRKQVLSLATIHNDQILLLTKYSLSCFDVLNNEQRFSLQFENAEKMQVLDNMIYVISGSTLYCYTSTGEEQYVNHLSSNITAIAKYSGPTGESNQLVIATEQLSMLRYSRLNIVFEYTKLVGLANSLCCVGRGVLVGTEQGPIAYYQSKKYKWKSKSVHAVLQIIKFQEVSQFSANNEFVHKSPERIVVVRRDGNMEIRDWENGGTLAKLKIGEVVIGVSVCDYRREGVNQLLCVTESGMVKAYGISEGEPGKESTTGVQQKSNEIETLNRMKQELLFNIAEMQRMIKQAPQQDDNLQIQQLVSAQFRLMASLQYKQGLVLTLTTSNGYISGLTFEQSLMPILVDKANKLTYKLQSSVQVAGEVVCEALVHTPLSTSKFEVRRINIFLTKFWKWGLDPTAKGEIKGRLRFKLVQRSSRYLLWLKQCFLINITEAEEQRVVGMPEMRWKFHNWYDQKTLQIVFNSSQSWVQIHCDCLKTMGQLFQDLINYVGVKNINSELYFPEQKQKIKQLLSTVEQLTQTKNSMSSTLADSINSIKFLLVKAESARVVSSMNGFRKTYGQIMEQNRNLVTEIEKKNQNTRLLTETLKKVNGFINEIANVRYGDSKSKVIAACREAIKLRRFPDIYGIMDRGLD